MGKSYRDLVAWQKAIELVTFVYRLTAGFPKEELYGLTSQLRRAAVSIPSNIAEGQGRKSNAEFRHFLHNAAGSLMEVETQVTIARVLGYLSAQDETELLQRTAELGRIINGLVNAIDNNSRAAAGSSA
jgi:four helix bundle protein